MKIRKYLWALLALPAVAWAQAQTPTQRPTRRFIVGDIRVEGLQRVSEGTVFNYLPVNIGDEMTPAKLREALRALYDTGFFRNVELRRDGNTLVVVVSERPSIESFEIKGNKDIKTEELTKSLRNVGLAPGKTFDRSVLEDVKGYLTDQYFSRGKYGVTRRYQGRGAARQPRQHPDRHQRGRSRARSARSASSATPSSRKRTSSRPSS